MRRSHSWTDLTPRNPQWRHYRRIQQKIQTLQKAVAKILENIEEFIKFDDQGQKVQGQNLASSVCTKFQVTLSKVLPAYPVISS